MIFRVNSQVADNYSYDEIQAALTHCGDGNPIVWLQENWSKLIETVQTLATKYGQERKENIVGTVSATEAKEALKKHRGNVWHAVTECIEQRQKSFNFINTQGKYLREDIVTYLTVHYGDRELALRDLSRLQLKPFLLKVIGGPAGADNESGNLANETTEWSYPIEQNNSATQMDEKAQIGTNDELANGAKGSINNNQTDMLKDLELIIGNMEEKQSKQTETIINTIENLLGNMVAAPNRPLSRASSFSMVSFDRLDVKSPILLQQRDSPIADDDVETDVKHFMSRHIQDIVPDVAAMVDKELNVSNLPINSIDHDAIEKESKRLAAIAELENEAENNFQKLTEQYLEETFIQQTDSLETNQMESIEMAVTKVEDPAINHQVEQQQTVEILRNEETIEEEINETSQKPNSNAVRSKSTLPKFVINKAFAKKRQQRYDRAVIRTLERQLLNKEKNKKAIKDQLRPSKIGQGVMQSSTEDSSNEVRTSRATILAINRALREIQSSTDDSTAEVNVQQIGNSIAVSLVDSSNLNGNDEKSFSIVINEQGQADDEQIDQSQLNLSTENLTQVALSSVEDVQPSTSVIPQATDDSASIGDGAQRNLSDLFQDTKNLIQQMKNEIDEDIAMSVSEFDEDTEFYETDSEEYEDEEDEIDEEVTEVEEVQAENDESDEWVDEDDDDDDDVDNDDEEEISDSSDNEAFAEAHENIPTSPVEALHDAQSIVNTVEIAIENVPPVDAHAMNSDSQNAPISSSADLESLNNLQQNILEIQQSLGSSIITLNVDDNNTPMEALNTDQRTDSIAQDIPEASLSNADAHKQTTAAANMENTSNVANGNASDESDESDEPEDEESESVSVEVSEEINEPNVATITPVPIIIQPSHTSTGSSSTEQRNIRATASPGRETLIESYTYKRTTVPVLSECSRSQNCINILELQEKKVEIHPPDVKPISKSDSQKSLKIKNKIPVRKNSLPGTSPNIRNIQNELIKKQETQPEKNPGKKPSKIVPPKVYLKTLTNKTTEIIKSLQPEKKNKSSVVMTAEKQLKSTPKKKYYETCFSDDYQTSDDESVGKTPKNMVKPQVIYKNEEIDDPEVYIYFTNLILYFDNSIYVFVFNV